MKSVREILHAKGSHVLLITGDETALQAAQLMRQHHLGALVVSQGPTVIGIVTERDIITRVVALEESPARTPVRNIMSTPCVVIDIDDSAAHCQAVMADKGVRHLPVVDDGMLVGMVTSRDILAHTADELEAAVQYMNEFVHGYSPGWG